MFVDSSTLSATKISSGTFFKAYAPLAFYAPGLRDISLLSPIYCSKLIVFSHNFGKEWIGGI